ncbi:MAG: hypothetical protein Q8J97_12060, partial [Flavobacteriaceae bacterium]|nr:hypothetical protein [Flavobacteriaceae bacterium]
NNTRGTKLADKIKGERITSATRPAAVVFGVHLSAQAVFRLDRKSPAVRICTIQEMICTKN